MTITVENLYRKLREDGGFTANGLGYCYSGDGFGVSVDGYQRTVPLDALTPDTFDLLFGAYAELCITSSGKHPFRALLGGARYIGARRYIGAWVDDGTVYFDLTEIVSDRAEAIRLGRERGQLAVWDFGANAEIRLAQLEREERRDIV